MGAICVDESWATNECFLMSKFSLFLCCELWSVWIRLGCHVSGEFGGLVDTLNSFLCSFGYCSFIAEF